MDSETYKSLLRTFEKWEKNNIVSPESLARAGQYYSGADEGTDETRCYKCQGRLCDWEAGDDPSEEHKSKYPDCPLSKDAASGVCVYILICFSCLK